MATLNLKKQQYLDIKDLLDAMSKSNMTKQMAFMIKINKTKLTEFETAVREASKSQISEFSEYEKKYEDLTKSFAVKNENGFIMSEHGKYIIPSDKKQEFEVKMKELNDENREVIDKRKSELEDFNGNFLNETYEMDLTPISFKYLPDNLGVPEIEILTPLVVESEQEIAEMLLK